MPHSTVLEETHKAHQRDFVQALNQETYNIEPYLRMNSPPCFAFLSLRTSQILCYLIQQLSINPQHPEKNNYFILTMKQHIILTSLFTVTALAAPTLKTRASCADAGQAGLTRGCTADHLYFVCTAGVETLYKCQGGCTVDSANQPRCDNGVVNSVSAMNSIPPITVIPVS